MTVKQRTTIFNPKDTNDNIIESVDSTHLKLSSIDFHCEDKFTLEAPKFKYIDKLRIQFNQFQSDLVLFNGYQNGLSIYCKPKFEDGEFDKEGFFQELNQTIGRIFKIPNDAWITSLDSLYYHDQNADIGKFISYISTLTENQQNVNLEIEPNIDYYCDGQQITLKLNARTMGSNKISKRLKSDKEIGLFLLEKGISTADDLVLSGLRVILNGDASSEEYLQKTLFHVKPRHRKLSGFYLSLIEANGMHPFLKTDIESEGPQDEDLVQCKLYYYLNLNKSLFADKYQLPREVNSYISFGNSDLELPEYKIKEWGSEILMEIEDSQSLSFPLHSRYQLPNNESSSRTVGINNPLIFYGCDVKDSYLLESSPFNNRLDIGGSYERFFTDNTVFYHLETDSSDLQATIPRAHGLVERTNYITNLAFVIGIALILFKIFKGLFMKKETSEEVSKKNQ